ADGRSTVPFWIVTVSPICGKPLGVQLPLSNQFPVPPTKSLLSADAGRTAASHAATPANTPMTSLPIISDPSPSGLVALRSFEDYRAFAASNASGRGTPVYVAPSEASSQKLRAPWHKR